MCKPKKRISQESLPPGGAAGARGAAAGALGQALLAFIPWGSELIGFVYTPALFLRSISATEKECLGV